MSWRCLSTRSLTKLLHPSLSCVNLNASTNDIPMVVTSSLTLSIQRFCGRPLLSYRALDPVWQRGAIGELASLQHDQKIVVFSLLPAALCQLIVIASPIHAHS